VSPADFIPVAEQTGLILPLTKLVLDEALVQWRYWRSEGIVLDLAVNLSPRVLLDPDLIEWVSAALVTHDVPGRRLILEITESSLAEGERATRAMAALRRLGVRLAVDDLGTGYSSLVYLKELPVDELKVDQSFIRHLADDPRDQSIVRAIVDLGTSLGLTVVAEGVEDAESLDILRQLGCPIAQGYYCCRPKPGPELTAWLSSRSEEPAAH
jgi:EAL domain-containing protein (putative c-di-GMP-specific phosphodiesterase class I)